MADPRIVKGASIPLFDRLIDLAPHSMEEGPVFRHIPADQLHASVLREIERILSTKRPITIEEALGETEHTVLEYGVPEAGAMSPHGRFARERFARALEIAIEAFEPRLHAPTVRAEFDPVRPTALRVVIQGTIRVGSYAEDVWFPLHINAKALGNRADG